MENGDKLGEDSVLCPIRQWSIIKAGPYWKPFPYITIILTAHSFKRNSRRNAATTSWQLDAASVVSDDTKAMYVRRKNNVPSAAVDTIGC